MTQSSAFHPFRKLPTELRLIIWRLCLPRRVHQLENPLDEFLFNVPREDAPSPCNLSSTTWINGRPPVITRVCRESRAVAFETGDPRSFQKTYL